MRDLGIIILGIIVAILLVKTGILSELLSSTKDWMPLGSFLAGIFFVSVFTAAPSAVVLFEMARSGSPFEIAVFGGLGALVGDMVIFQFVKNSLSEDIEWFMKRSRGERLVAIFRFKLFRWLVPFMGALIVASPLPDEIGIAMMGLSKMKTALFVPISFSLNTLGILIIGLIAKGVV